MASPFPAPLERFVEMFRRGAFWESHEVLEAPWRTGRSGFYKGLILLASAWVHVQRGNPRGIAAQLAKAERALEPYRPWYLGVDVEALVAGCAEGRRVVASHPGVRGFGWEALLPPPRIELSPARVRGDEAEGGGAGG